MNLQESGEMYLETILRLTSKSDRVRSIDISEEMGFSKPSVSRAIGLLRGGGYVQVSKEGYLSLTDIGKEVAERVYERHKILTDFLVLIGVENDFAVADACKIEHCISEESFTAIKNYTESQKQEGKTKK